jgi:GT2 family glycosyltransferase
MDAGIAWGLAHGFEVVTVLNNDTVVDPGCLDRLVATVLEGPGAEALADGAAYAVSPRVTYLDNPSRAWFDGGLLDPADGLPRHTSPAESAALAARAAPPGGAYPVDLLAGCCITATAGTWRLVGDFDERYFLNFEDSDWSLRAREAGVTLLVEPRATVRHRVSGSFVGQHSYLGTFYYTRNLLLFARSWRGHGTRGAAMLWARVIRPLPSQARHDGAREALRRGAVVGAAVAAYLSRRYGRAPARVERRAARWARGR